jgi:hypothetical protein
MDIAEAPLYFYGKNISQSTRFKETEVFHSSQESMFSLRPRQRFYARFRCLPHLFSGISQ